jgi:two-component sensor histidine kinase
MMRIYEQLYSTQSLSHVDLRTYVEELTRGLFKTYALDAEHVRLSTDIISIPLDLRIVVPLGLILNELIANALKYAFPAGAPGELGIALDRNDGMLVLHVRDNGVGLPDGIDLEAVESLGIRLVMMLTEQLGGTVTFESRGGTHVVVTIPG